MPFGNKDRAAEWEKDKSIDESCHTGDRSFAQLFKSFLFMWTAGYKDRITEDEQQGRCFILG